MAPPVHESTTDTEKARATSEAKFGEHTFKHGSMIPLFYTQNAWVRSESARRYGGGSGQVQSGEADLISSDGEGAHIPLILSSPSISLPHFKMFETDETMDLDLEPPPAARESRQQLR